MTFKLGDTVRVPGKVVLSPDLWAAEMAYFVTHGCFPPLPVRIVTLTTQAQVDAFNEAERTGEWPEAEG